jgi:protein-S-isoprenylcysteine O-methyltransferase Ste14
LALMVGPAVYRFMQFELLVEWVVGGGGIVLYALWQAYESRISVAELDKEEALHDAGTMPLAAVAKLILLMTAMLGGGIQRYEFGALAVVVFLAGVVLRSVAVNSLEGHYSHRIRRPPALVTTGVYGWLRHPAYAGTLLAHAAVPLFFPNPYAVAGFWLAWFPAVIVRTVVEDRFLRRDLGEEYEAYAAKTSRLIPGIW